MQKLTLLTRSALAALALLAVQPVAGSALAQELNPDRVFDYTRAGRNESVADRPRPDFDPKGLRLGTIEIFPELRGQVGLDSNVFYQDSNERDDVVTVLTPQIAARTDWARHRLSGEIGLSDTRYNDNESEDHTDVFARGEARLDIVRGTYVLLGGNQERLTERRGAPDSPFSAAKPIRYEVREAYVQGVHAFNRARISLRADRENLNFKDAPLIGGGVADQDQRDRTTTGLTARAEYALSPDAALVAQVTQNMREYRLKPPRAPFNRNSNGGTYLFGVNADLTNLLRGELIVGYLQQDYKDPALKTASGVALEGSLEYFPTPLTTFKLNASRRVEETLTGTASSFVATYVNGRVDHELRRNIILDAALGATKRDFQGQSRTDDLVSAEAGARFLLNRRAEVGARWQFETQDSKGPVSDPDYNVNRFFVSATARF